jgi:endonuclease III
VYKIIQCKCSKNCRDFENSWEEIHWDWLYTLEVRTKEDTLQILRKLDRIYGKVEPFLVHSSPFQLLIAAILSAQTTDAMVNKVTVDLFKRFPDAESLGSAEAEEVAQLVKRINYYKTKSRNIVLTAKMIVEEFKGDVPADISLLVRLPGVGRKVANVIMADVHGIPAGIVVDTHVKRVSSRIGWTSSKEPDKIEQDLLQQWSQEYFVNTPKQLILIGRNYCFPRNPVCSLCPLRKLCLQNGVVEFR